MVMLPQVAGPSGRAHPFRTPWLRLLSTELRIQTRSGLYAAYAAVTAFFVLLLLIAPTAFRPRVFELIVLLDPSFMGYFFAGGLILLERDQGVLPLVVTRGHGFRSWWQAKVLAVGTLAAGVVAALVVFSAALGILRFPPFGLAIFALGLLLTVPAFLSLGVAMASRFPRVIDYFVYSGVIMTPVMFPLVELIGISVGPIGAISPAWGTLVLVTSLFEPMRSVPEIVAAVTTLLFWNIVAYRLAKRGFAKLAGVASGVTAPAPSARETAARSRAGRPRGSAGWTELRLILRDPATCAILLAPLLVAPLLGRVLPWALSPGGPLAELVSAAVAGEVLGRMDYVRSFAIVLNAILYGMLGGLLFLDEKDIGMLPVLKTLPGPRGWFLFRRCRRLLLFHAVALIAAVPLGGLYHGGPAVFAVSLVVDALAIPFVFFAMGAVAKTKVHGLAVAKVLSICMVAPLLISVLPVRWAWAVGVFPTAWGTLMRTTATGGPEIAAAAVAGLAYAGVAGALLHRRALTVGVGGSG